MVLILLCLPLSVRAEPTVNKDVEYYDIKGRDIPFLMGEMDAKGPRDMNSGDKVWAHTKWRVRWSGDKDQTRTSCRHTNIQTTLHLTFVVPRWVDNDGVSEQVKKEWERFYAALQKHEYKHAMHGMDAANEIEQALLNMDTEASCRNLDEKTKKLVDDIIKKHARRDVVLDDETNNGRTEGVLF